MVEVTISREAGKWDQGSMHLRGEEVASWSGNELGSRAVVALVHETLDQYGITPSQARWRHNVKTLEQSDDTDES